MCSTKIFSVVLLTLGLIGFTGGNLCLLADNNDPPHLTHLVDLRGPLIANCDLCHIGSPAYDNVDTNVCNNCHSPGGAYNGVNDPAVGSLNNWENMGSPEGATQSMIYSGDGRLKSGKENWCATCHDDGSSVINGVSAPNVMGDNTNYGYTVTGHGEYAVRCDDCHDLTTLHIDGQARTYSASNNNYREGYRLNEDMAIPRYGQYGPNAFKLCFKCHIYSNVFGPVSNFRDDNLHLYLHETHLGPSFSQIYVWDSDWSGGACTQIQGQMPGCDSAISCTACHNVHGSPCIIGSSIVTCSNPLKTPMIRHGELISTPGTQDKVPALQFHWYDANYVPTTDLNSSRYGGLLCDNYNVSFNHVCWGCHTNNGEVKYYRAPPTIGYRPTSFNFTATQGGSNPSNRTLSISNTGSGTLNWIVNDNATWLSLSPTSGTNSGTVTASVNIASLTAGTYNATITITATGATNSPVNIPVTLTISYSTECNLIPAATVIPRGGTLELQATVTNNTDKPASVLAATKVTLPNGNKYPPSGFLFGPISLSLDPYESKSGHLSHAIPLGAPLGSYTYHGYVGNYGPGNYSECHFNFTVSP